MKSSLWSGVHTRYIANAAKVLAVGALVLFILDSPSPLLGQWTCTSVLCSPPNGQAVSIVNTGTNPMALQVSNGDTPGVITAQFTDWGSNNSNIVQIEGSNAQTYSVNDYLLLSRMFNSNVTVAPGGGVGIRFDIYNSSQVFQEAAEIAAVVSAVNAGGTQNNTSDLAFSTQNNSASPTEAMRITGSGNVGIGTTTPGFKLSVQGSSQDGVSASVGNTAGSGSYPYVSLTHNGPNGFGIADWPNASVLEGAGSGGLILDGLLAPVKFQIGRVTQMAVTSGGVGIGTPDPHYPLSVNGTIQAKEVIVNTGWSDYVFDPGYHLAPLREVANYVKEKHHLPDLPSAADVQVNGVSLGDMQSKLLAKIEELTLHMIHAEERSDRIEHENGELRREIEQLKARAQ